MSTARLPAPYWRLWSASTAANLADGIREAALPLIAAGVARDPALVAGVAVAQRLPWLVIGLPAGVLIDRVDPRRLAASANAVRAAAVLALAVALATGRAGPAVLLAVALVLGIGEVLVDGAMVVAVPALVDRTQLPRANGALASGQITANEFVGPPLGAALFAVGAAVPAFADAGLLALAVVLLLGLPALVAPVPATTAPAEPPTAALRAGVAAVRRSPDLRRLVAGGGVLAAADGAWFTLLVLFVAEVLDAGPATFGGLLAVGATGGLLGSALADRAIGPRRAGTALAGAALATAVGQVAIGLTSSVAVVAAGLAVTSAAFAVFNVASMTVRQTAAPTGVLGRVTTTYQVVVVTGGAVGAAVGGVVATLLGPRAPMLVTAPALVVAAALVRRVSAQDPPPTR